MSDMHSNHDQLRVSKDALCMSQEFVKRDSNGKIFSFVDNNNIIDRKTTKVGGE